MRALVLSFGLACAACEAIAPVDIKYVKDETVDNPEAGGEAGAKPDAGSIVKEDGSAIGIGSFCGCDFSQGFGCCLPTKNGQPYCTQARESCTAGGGLYVSCVKFDPNGRGDCCWNNGTTAGGSTSLANECGSRPPACTTTQDCASGTCEITTCQGLKIGACGIAPTCP